MNFEIGNLYKIKAMAWFQTGAVYSVKTVVNERCLYLGENEFYGLKMQGKIVLLFNNDDDVNLKSITVDTGMPWGPVQVENLDCRNII